MKVLVTGSAGFIAGYLVQDLIDHGYEVIGIDNYSKYGPVTKSYDNHPSYRLVEGDAKDVACLKELVADCDYLVAAAAMIGGITYFHEFAYDLFAENERILASTFDAAIWGHQHARLKKITVLSSSMVFENAFEFPTPESHLPHCPAPTSTYGFQKLACEYFARGAYEQYGLPYTVARPFNCVGVGEQRALHAVDVNSGDVQLAMSHVVPDLVQKLLKGQDPLHILGSGDQVRHYTYGGDLATGIRLCMEHHDVNNHDFNLSTAQPTTVLELAEAIWEKIHGDSPLRIVHDEPYPHDVQLRTPNVDKARQLLGFEANTSLNEILDEVIPWVAQAVRDGCI